MIQSFRAFSGALFLLAASFSLAAPLGAYAGSEESPGHGRVSQYPESVNEKSDDGEEVNASFSCGKNIPPAPVKTDYASIYVHSNEHNDDPDLSDKLAQGKIESIEFRYYLDVAAQREGNRVVKKAKLRGMYFEAIHHIPESHSESMGGKDFWFCKPNGTLTVRKGMSLLDYRKSYDGLKKNTEQLYTKLGLVTRDGLRWGVPAAGVVAALKLLEKYVAKKEWGGISLVAQKLQLLYRGKVGEVAAAGGAMVLLVAVPYIWEKYLNGHKLMADTIDKGRFIPGWDGAVGEEFRQRAWLEEMLFEGNELGHGRTFDNALLEDELLKARFDQIKNGAEKNEEAEQLKKDIEAGRVMAFRPYVSVENLPKALVNVKSYFEKYLVIHADDRRVREAQENEFRDSSAENPQE